MSKSRKKSAARPQLRSRSWFDNPANADMTALYLERTMNFGLSMDELQSGRPMIGIAQSGSDIAPCNRHHLVLAERVREGIRDAGGVAFEFPIHPIQETCKRPTAALDRNLQYLSLVEILYGYPLDGVVLTTGCDKTTPAQLMAAATVDIPGHRAEQRADAQRLARGRAHRLRHHRVEGARADGRGQDRLCAVPEAGGLVGAVHRPLQHHGHGLDDELADRGAGHVPAGQRGHSCALP